MRARAVTMETPRQEMGAVPDARPNSSFSKTVQAWVGGFGLAGLVSLAVAWGALGQKVTELEKDVKPVAENSTKVAVIETDLRNIKEDIGDVKKDVKEVLKQLQRMNGGDGN